jgi:hypothetical protein
MILKTRCLLKHLGRTDDFKSRIRRRRQILHHESKLVLGTNILGSFPHCLRAAPYNRQPNENRSAQTSSKGRTHTEDRRPLHGSSQTGQ